MEKTIAIMRGLPGSGKTTEARMLANDCKVGNGAWSFSLCSADLYFGWNRDTYVKNFDPAKLPAAHKWCLGHTQFAMEQNTDLIIIDNCNVMNAHMKPYIDMARDFGYTVKFREPYSLIWTQHVRLFLSGEMHNRTWIKNRCQELSDLTQDTHCVPADSIMRMMFAWEEVAG